MNRTQQSPATGGYGAFSVCRMRLKNDISDVCDFNLNSHMQFVAPGEAYAGLGDYLSQGLETKQQRFPFVKSSQA